MKRIIAGSLVMLCTGFLRAQSPLRTDSVKNADTLTKTFAKVEIESEFPGGAKGWAAFLGNTLVYPKKAVRKKIEGQVIVRFIIEKDGTVSNISIVSGPEELQQAVLDAMMQSPRWKPAVQDGKKVKSYKQQPVNFRLPS